MTASAWVVEVQGDERRLQRGLYYFVELPIPGDRVTLPSGRGALDVMSVVQVEHAPVPDSPQANSPPREEPLATVFVQKLEDEGRR